MTKLEAHLREIISAQGPVDIAYFMSLALAHPVHGYYMTHDPFGRGGDFTTAPEISQMFGEMLGAWAADLWTRMGAPPRLSLIECGPGRGTLMADALRATRRVAGFHAALDLHLVEISPVLKAAQAQALRGHTPRWHEGIETVPRGVPAILLANEFLDALPVRQFVKTPLGWAERKVGVDAQGNLAFFNVPTANPPPESSPLSGGRQGGDGSPPPCEEGRPGGGSEPLYEDPSARNAFLRAFAAHFQGAPAAALFLDYGHDRSGFGDTLQAVFKHQYAPVLENMGEADLTAHVDFAALKREALASGLRIQGPISQGAFLKNLGIEARAEVLLGGAPPRQGEEIRAALARLVEPDKMGTLFKVMFAANAPGLQAEGFA